MKNDYVSIGKITSSHGVHGFAKILLLTDFPERFEKLKRVFIFPENSKPIETKIEQIKFTSKHMLIKFDFFNSPEEVKNYSNSLIKIPYEERFELPEENYYIDDLKGLTAYSTKGKLLGKVKDIYYTSHEILEIRTPDKKDIMVPFIKEFVTDIDIPGQKLYIKLIPGLFD